MALDLSQDDMNQLDYQVLVMIFDRIVAYN